MAEAVYAPIILDGAYGEGGGALIRTALVMSALTQQPLRIDQVRGNLRAQGLQPEDMALIEALRLSCHAEMTGFEAGATQFSFLPTRRPRAIDATINVPDGPDGNGHANALVVANSLLPLLARTGAYSFITAHGETFGLNALSYDAFTGNTLCALAQMGMHVECDQIEAGFGRGSRGQVRLEVEPSVLQGVDWSSRGELLSLQATLSFGELPDQIAERGIGFLNRLAQSSGIQFETETVRVKTKTPGIHLTLCAEFERGFGSSQAMGAKGLRVETVVQTGFERFMSWFKSESTVDEYLIDQLIVAAALAESPSTFKVHRLTQRFLTTVWVIKQFIPIHITVKGHENEAGTVTVRR